MQGYTKKKRQLCQQLEELKCDMSSFKGTTDDHPTSSKAIEHASSLAHDDDGSVHTTLMKLFRPKSNPTEFNPSATPATATRKSLKLPRKLKSQADTTKQKATKTVSIVSVAPGTISIPKDKMKLRNEGRLKFIDLSNNDAPEEVSINIHKVFSMSSEKLLYLQATQSGDLFEASAQVYNGEAVLKLVKNGCLYVRFVPLVTKQPVQVLVRPSFRNDPAPKVVVPQPPSSSNAIAIFC